jgi:hypothetical protein
MSKLEFASFHYENIENLFGFIACPEHMKLVPCETCTGVRKSSHRYSDDPALVKMIITGSKR